MNNSPTILHIYIYIYNLSRSIHRKFFILFLERRKGILFFPFFFFILVIHPILRIFRWNRKNGQRSSSSQRNCALSRRSKQSGSTHRVWYALLIAVLFFFFLSLLPRQQRTRLCNYPRSCIIMRTVDRRKWAKPSAIFSCLFIIIRW